MDGSGNLNPVAKLSMMGCLQFAEGSAAVQFRKKQREQRPADPRRIVVVRRHRQHLLGAAGRAAVAQSLWSLASFSAL